MKPIKLLCVVLLTAVAQAHAGVVILRSDTWSYIYNVEIREGNSENPELNQLIYRGPVDKGAEFRSRDGVYQCYRRSRDPANPDSNLTEWNCNARTISGSEYWSLS